MLSPLSQLKLDSSGSGLPLYRQLAEAIRRLVDTGELQTGDRLPATRELAGQLGLNRTTVSAAYAALEESGFLEGQVGRGSFVAARKTREAEPYFAAEPLDWDTLFPAGDWARPQAASPVEISFASSRPPEEDFPLAVFRQLAKDTIESAELTEILQLGSPLGYGPLRRYLLAQAQDSGLARAGDDILITNGCQQALDLLARFLSGSTNRAVAVEDPVYHGLTRVLGRSAHDVIPVPVTDAGIDIEALGKALAARRPRLLIVTPSFQNPTGATLSVERRKTVIRLAHRFGTVLVENDIYSELRYEGEPLPTLKELDQTGNTILLRSYSKIAFPGLRVGWVLGPRPVVARLAEKKQWADLHSDHLSQAILLRFAESGELTHHLERTRRAGKDRLHAVCDACSRYLPSGSRWRRPQGGMSLWVELPAPLRADSLLARARERGIDYLPGSYFSSGEAAHARSLRLGFGGLSPAVITRGVQILGGAAREELAAYSASAGLEPAMALV